MSFRTYHQVAGEDRSRLGEQVGRQLARVTERLRDVRRVVAIVSGKGGVGKSHVTASLAVTLSRGGAKVGVLDADLQSPTVARMLGALGPLLVDNEGVNPAIARDDVRVISMDLLLEEGAPLRWPTRAQAWGAHSHTWRGVAETGALREFLGDVCWGTLDYLLVDMPPDAHRLEDLAELAPALHGIVAVTIPSDESRRSVARALNAAREHKVRILGVVENMSGYACDECHTIRPLFSGDAGAQLSAEFDVPLLGRIPFQASLGEGLRLPEALVTAITA